MKGEGFKIMRRERVKASPPAGQDQAWVEYQVFAGRKISARFDLLEQALKEYPGAELDVSVTQEDAISRAGKKTR